MFVLPRSCPFRWSESAHAPSLQCRHLSRSGFGANKRHLQPIQEIILRNCRLGNVMPAYVMTPIAVSKYILNSEADTHPYPNLLKTCLYSAIDKESSSSEPSAPVRETGIEDERNRVPIPSKPLKDGGTPHQAAPREAFTARLWTAFEELRVSSNRNRFLARRSCTSQCLLRRTEHKKGYVGIKGCSKCKNTNNYLVCSQFPSVV